MTLKELAPLFLKLGAFGFGGPAAHVALMEAEVVRRRGWIDREKFLDLWSATHLIPGPNSTEMALYLGYHRAGFLGLVVAGLCFIFPAMVCVMAVAWFYTRFGALPALQGIFYGMKPVLVVVLVQALWGFGQTSIKSSLSVVVMGLALILCAAGVDEILVLVISGLLGVFFGERPSQSLRLWGLGIGLLLVQASAWASAMLGAPVGYSIQKLFWFFLKTGSVLYGSGYVLLAYLRSDLVEARGWLSQQQILDAAVVGLITPGPVFTTATFIGYLLGGPSAALVATVGIFLPAFVVTAVSVRWVTRLRASSGLAGFLDGVNSASVALLAVVAWRMATTALVGGATFGIAAAGAFLILYRKVNSVWVLLLAGGVGFLVSR